jgi:tetratricopeptide (TPR) repeat protein
MPRGVTPLRLNELESEFFRWLGAGSRRNAVLMPAKAIRHLGLLADSHRILVGRREVLGTIADHVNQRQQSLINVFGGSGSGKTELVRGWWKAAEPRITGHVLAISCRRQGGTDDVFDFIRKLCEVQPPGVSPNEITGVSPNEITRRFVELLKSSGNRPNLVVFDDLDFLMHQDIAGVARGGGDISLRFDRAGLRELIGALVGEVRPIVVVVTSLLNLSHLFDGYPGFLPLDINRGLEPESGAELISSLMSARRRPARRGLSRERLKAVSKRLRGVPQSLVYFAQLLDKTPHQRWSTLVDLHDSAVAAASDDGLAGATELASLLDKSTLNFVRVVAAMEKGLPSNVLEVLVEDESCARVDKRVFRNPSESGPGMDSNVDKALGLVEQITGAKDQTQTVFDMHLTARTAILRKWRIEDPRSYERFHNWLAKFYWMRAFPNIRKGFHPRELPDQPEQLLPALLCLLDCACSLVRGATVATNVPEEGGQTSQPVRKGQDIALNSDLSAAHIDDIFSDRQPASARVRFAYRRIVAQRVDRLQRGEKSHERKSRFGLTRQLGRHEAKIRFLALLAPRLFYGTSESEPLDLIDQADQGQVVFDIGHNSVQLGWLQIAVTAFKRAGQLFDEAGDNLNSSRCKALEATTLMRCGLLANAYEALEQAELRLGLAQAKAAADDKTHDQSASVAAMVRRLKSYRAHYNLLSGETKQALLIQHEIHETARDEKNLDHTLLAHIKDRVQTGGHTPTIARIALTLPSVALSGEKGRAYIETQLICNPDRAEEQLGYWWTCLQMASDDGVEVEHTHLHILEAAIHRLRGDPDEAKRALEDADRMGERYNVHFPVRLEWRLERVRYALAFRRYDEFKQEERRLETVLELSRDYGFRLLECDGLIVKAWLEREQRREKSVIEVTLADARGLGDQMGYTLRRVDIDRVRRGESVMMVPLI